MNLQNLGWQPFFQQQLTLEDYEDSVVSRISAHHRSGYQLITEKGEVSLPMHESLPSMTVGDWVLLDHEQQFQRRLERSSVFSRKAAGSKLAEQYIAANIDTVFIVMSLNDDFNLSRVERYLALTNEAQVEAVIVLTKADLCEDAEALKQQVQSLDPMLMIEAVNALDFDSVQSLTTWCKTGKTVAFLGSSGVGKSTLVNTLLQTEAQKTGSIREDDSKGRHTTTGRTIHPMPSGGVLLDTPGMRELQLANVAQGISETFSDVEEIASQCRFSDCSHQNEPGCAIQKALQSGELDDRRLNNYLKLQREQARNSASLAELRSHDKQLGKMYRSVQNESRARKNK
ncbi:ribosome small subunit-dependent GTPase A [Vibrio breoganii]|uniref:ribosome small subunit-dependent GTPase A n=1 Tax=Vibrio breoganii TaxID=553239 RepID=UPI000C84C036|nr:ribosome small subunit-dependent GTPase A [Vibrio breoganii]PMK33166.1 ribosome small subunit-dependent GTPase A [Vibrio breoganii]PML53440.1 ribosome small subunit-dependent GTPase A [Vibrio breoganii]PMM85204.1 ribosome small subunit-dependent GTPase A [Vibrio breoganii]PMO78726.1 ribosome small subunit-dependent GTPase A [Vibrio breoganii]PMO98686.1 ribosome small subunit-dependent GTPase A [Vibrio breoganii]